MKRYRVVVEIVHPDMLTYWGKDYFPRSFHYKTEAECVALTVNSHFPRADGKPRAIVERVEKP